MPDNISDIDMNFSLIDSLLAHISIIDSSGFILETNAAWQQFDDTDAQIKRGNAGKSYFKSLQQAVEQGNDYALKMILGINNVLEGEKDTFSIIYPLRTQSNSFWFKMTVRPCNDELNQFMMIHEDISSSMQAKYEHEKNVDRFQVKFEQSLDGIFITDSKGKILEANPMASKVLGWTSKELIGRSIGAVLNIEAPTYRDALDERKKSGTFTLEIDFIHKNGKLIPVEASSRIYRNPKGKLRAIMTFKDISKRKAVEQNLIKTEHFTESALSSIPGIFFVLDRNMNLVRWNENMVTSLGYTAEELTKKKALDFIIDERQENAHENIMKCIDEGEVSTETQMHSKERGIRDYFIRAKRFTEEGKVYIVGTGIDITENKKVERENQRHQIMLEQLFDNSPVGIAIVSNNHKIQQINKSFSKIFDYEENEVLDKNINDLLAPKDRRTEAEEISAATQKGKSMQAETIRLNKSGEEVPVLIGSVPVEVKDEVVAIYGIYVDVSAQHNYRREIEQALSEKEALLSELHHRVKNNLALINSLVQLQLFNSKNPDLIQELTNIKNRIMTIASIHEVLYQQGSFTNIPFEEFLQELLDTNNLQSIQNTRNVSINTDTSDLQLNINQSIPGGLLVNELLSLIFSSLGDENETDLHIRLREYGSNVHLIVEGENIVAQPKEVREGQSVHNILIETLTMQLGGTMVWPNPNSECHKFEFIFERQNGSSPASGILDF